MRKCQYRKLLQHLPVLIYRSDKMVVEIQWIKGSFCLMLLLQTEGEYWISLGEFYWSWDYWFLFDIIVWQQWESHRCSEKETKPHWSVAMWKEIRQNAIKQPGFSPVTQGWLPWNWWHWENSRKSIGPESHCRRTVPCWSRRSKQRTLECTSVSCTSQDPKRRWMSPCTTCLWLPVSTDATSDKHRTKEPARVWNNINDVQYCCIFCISGLQKYFNRACVTAVV